MSGATGGPTVAFINDYNNLLRISIVYSGEDFVRIENLWGNEDRILVDMQFHPKFAERRRWCDLDQDNFCVMIAANMSKIGELPPEVQADYSNSAYRSLEFIVLGLIRCIQIAGQCSVDTININRVTHGNVVISYCATLDNAVAPSSYSPSRADQPDDSLFKIIVDNSGSEQ